KSGFRISLKDWLVRVFPVDFAERPCVVLKYFAAICWKLVEPSVSFGIKPAVAKFVPKRIPALIEQLINKIGLIRSGKIRKSPGRSYVIDGFISLRIVFQLRIGLGIYENKFLITQPGYR